MTIIVRRALVADAPALPDIERCAAKLFRDDPSLAWLADSPVPGAEHHRWAIEAGQVWVAQSAEGALAGFLAAGEIDNQLHIQELSVSQPFQGRGIGRKLVLAAVSYARGQELAGLTLTTFRDLPWNELFYRRMGFATLSPAETEPRLTQVLNDEIAHGLPGERRCAMRFSLGPAPLNPPPMPRRMP
ncbi:hypothetical protein PS662_01502 [Pseudomonas fluorescens]|uniref:N-acetyltransferase domain-containing protein n=1 Tax=Pseudomonas fluorescens TaxID=294 RepID=A0A5E6RAL2_PSEFL|nr:GNAT family N-acetyltransferase [Pseudomonas fluorescens]VVM65021.1 hypothetical protein PS662_01502 [Pseudomonas fluorescens]